jgi:protein tyrosine/serine phosphatase
MQYRVQRTIVAWQRWSHAAGVTEPHPIPLGVAADRFVPMAGIRNFRDYGGYRARGGQIRRGLLFRSGQHGAATDEDIARLDDLALSLIVDLRGGGERRRAPCRRSPTFTGTVILVDAETAGLAPHIAAARDNGADARTAMGEGYRAMPFRPVLVDILGRYFAALAETSGPSLVHCAAGKDRTGLAVALLHDMLGVHPDDLVADYMLTNQAEPDPMLRLEGVRRMFGMDMDDQAVRELLSVRPEYLAAALDSIRERHGSLDAYRTDVLGVGAAQQRAIAEHLMV